MRFAGTTKSRVDQDVTVYQIVLGSQEIRLLLGIIENTYGHIPGVFELGPEKNRLKNMIRCLRKVTEHYDLKKPHEYDEKS